MQRDSFRFLPLLGVERDSRGIIRNVTDRLLEAEGLRRRDVIGRPLIAVWPHGSQWLELDRRALQQRKPLVQIEPSAHARWFRSTRVPTGRRVLWYGEDVTDIVKARAALGLAAAAQQLPRGRLIVGQHEQLFIEMLLDGVPLEQVAQRLDMSLDEVAGGCIRAIRRSA